MIFVLFVVIIGIQSVSNGNSGVQFSLPHHLQTNRRVTSARIIEKDLRAPLSNSEQDQQCIVLNRSTTYDGRLEHIIITIITFRRHFSRS